MRSCRAQNVLRFSFSALIFSVGLVVLSSRTLAASTDAAASGTNETTKSVKPSSEIPDRREFPLNTAIKPCDNFYDYVCSDVIASFQLREDRSRHTFAFDDSNERLLLKKQAFFKTLSHRETKTKREEGLKNYYLACMDEKSGARDEKKEVKRITSAFSEMKDRSQVLSWIEKSHLSPEADPIDWGPISNMEVPVNSDLYLVTDLMTLPEKTYYKNADVMADFKALAINFYKTIGVKEPEKKAETLLKIESQLAEVYPAPAEFRKIVHDRRFIDRAQLLKEFPNLGLEPLLAKVPNNITIRHWVPESLKSLNDFLGAGDLDDIKTVLLFHALSAQLDDAYPDYFKQKFEFNRKHFGGPNQRPVREERCTKSAMSTFGKEIDSILLPELFPNFPREKIVSLAEQIRATLTKSLAENKWLSKAAREEAVKKMKTARLFLVSPQTDKEWDFLPEATYKPNEPLENNKTIAAVFRAKNLRDLNEPRDPARWSMSPLTVNAYYDASDNKFVLPVGILQYPFFDANRPLEVNLGSVGSVVGHEMGHGVDDQGSRFDDTGKQREWMSKHDLAEFAKRTQKLVTQFDKAGQNGKLTLGENIGDLVGVTMALGAASQDPEFKKSPERKKAFFESYARNWCQVMRPMMREKLIKTDPHSLGPNRVNEQLKQQVSFATTYQCKNTDSMVLKKADIVHLW